MKLLVISTLALISLCADSAISLTPGDNRHYEEDIGRYFWMHGDNSDQYLVDTKAPIDYGFLATQNGANNQYWLFTRNNPNSKDNIYNNDIDSVRNSNYVANRPLIVIFHGWRNNGNSDVIKFVKSAVLDTMDANVIVVDWSGVAGNTNYFTAAAGVPSVGQYTGLFLIWLINNAGGNWNNVHIIGHSLGAHAAGNAGCQTGKRPARIGLDAALPSWQNNDQALKKSDALYVEAIHTDGNVLGIFTPVGDADFYPNGGTNPQPGCLLSTCSHNRAFEFFASSIRTNHFVGAECPNHWEANLGTCYGAKFNMGNNILTKRGSGIYHLRTGSSWPF